MNPFYYSIYGPYIERFIDHKRSLGFKYKGVEWYLRLFDRLSLEREEDKVGISKELANEWGSRQRSESTKTRCARICLINGFSCYLTQLGFDSYIVKSLPKVISTYTPYIFSKVEIASMFKFCDQIERSMGNVQSSKYCAPALMRLLYGTGIRLGEALDLKCDDVDIVNKHLTLRNCKNGKDRLIPLSDSVNEICKGYLKFRDNLTFLTPSCYFFVKPNGDRCSKDQPYAWFRIIIHRAGIPHGGKGLGPRLHDLRHTFSVHALAKMAEEGLDLYYCLPILSSYLGHSSIDSTDKYVKLTAEMYPSVIANANKLSPYLFPQILSTETNEAD